MYFFLLYNDCENEGPFKYFYKGVKRMYKYLHILNDIEKMIQHGEIKKDRNYHQYGHSLRNMNVIRQQLYVRFMNWKSVILYILSSKWILRC